MLIAPLSVAACALQDSEKDPNADIAGVGHGWVHDSGYDEHTGERDGAATTNMDASIGHEDASPIFDGSLDGGDAQHRIPRIYFTNPNPFTTVVGRDEAYTVVVENLEISTYQWKMINQEILIAETTEPELIYSYNTPGVYLAKVSVPDRNGGILSDTLDVRVLVQNVETNPRTDAGSFDGGRDAGSNDHVLDAGTSTSFDAHDFPDASSVSDAGMVVDGGLTALDAGSSSDAGEVDGGTDGGVTLPCRVRFEWFGGLQEPFSKQFYDQTFDEIKMVYGDHLDIIFKHFPLFFLHQYAYPSAEAAECARDQGKFWEYLDGAFAVSPQLDRQSLETIATNIGLEMVSFRECLDSGVKHAVVEADYNEAVVRGLLGSPAFFINGELLMGSQSYSAFDDVLDQALETACTIPRPLYNCGWLSDYTAAFVTDGVFNGYLVVGVNGPAMDNLTMTDIAALMRYINETGELQPVAIVDALRLDTQIQNVTFQNLISIGTPCVNSITAGMYQTSTDCSLGMQPGEAKIRMWQNRANGMRTLTVTGYAEQDTLRAGQLLNVLQQSGVLEGCEMTLYSDGRWETTLR